MPQTKAHTTQVTLPSPVFGGSEHTIPEGGSLQDARAGHDQTQLRLCARLRRAAKHPYAARAYDFIVF